MNQKDGDNQMKDQKELKLHKTLFFVKRLMVFSLIILFNNVNAYCQEAIFPEYPVWFSGPSNLTRSVVLGDIDLDGDLDLVCGNQENNTLYKNNDGLFEKNPSWMSVQGICTYKIALGDIDGDGDLDLICGNEGSNSVYLNEDGIFSDDPYWESPTQFLTNDVALGDIDNNGYLDLISANKGDVNTIYYNHDGIIDTTLGWHSGFAKNSFSVELADITGDGFLDIIFGYHGLEAEVYENSGGSFTSEPYWKSADAYYRSCVAAGDLNGDGLMDIIRGNDNFGPAPYGGDNNSVYYNSGNTLSTSAGWNSADLRRSIGIAVGDLDKDGLLDLVFSNYYQSNTAYINNSSQGFPLYASWESSPGNESLAVALGDIDGDGDLDAVFANFGQPNTLYFNNSVILEENPEWVFSLDSYEYPTILTRDIDLDGDYDLVCGSYTNIGNDLVGMPNFLIKNEGGGLLDYKYWETSASDTTLSIDLGDVDGDGYPDLACGNKGSLNTIYKNTGDSFTETPFWNSSPANNTYCLKFGDINGDGFLDLVCGNDGINVIYFNKSGLLSEIPGWYSEEADNTISIELADIDNDGDIDLVCGNLLQKDRIYYNEGGVLNSSCSWSTFDETDTRCMKVGYINNDDMPDLVIAGDGNKKVYLNDGGIFQSYWDYSIGTGEFTRSISLGDVDRDGYLDVAAGNVFQNDNLFKNNEGILESLPEWTSGSAWGAVSNVLCDIDTDGDLDLICGNRGNLQYYKNKINLDNFKDPANPVNQLPNNRTLFKSVKVRQVSDQYYEINFWAFDVESDDFWLIPEYKFTGTTEWIKADIRDHPGRLVGPFITRPSGVHYYLEWFTGHLKFDKKDVILRLRPISIPQRVSKIQNIPSYFINAGKIQPYHPVLSVSQDSLIFPTVTVGDTASLELCVSNTGNENLTITDIGLPAEEIMTYSHSVPSDISPGLIDTFNFFLIPDTEIEISADFTIHSNDPLTPVLELPSIIDVRDLDFNVRLLNPKENVPLGEELLLNIIPSEGVRIEGGYLYYRASGSGVEFEDSVKLVLFPEGDFMANIPGDKVTEAGLDYYIKVTNSGFISTAPEGAPEDSVYFQAVEQPELINTYASPNRENDYLDGRDISISVGLPEGAVFKSGKIYCRNGGESTYHSLDINCNELLTQVSIPDSIVSPRGVEYYVEVQTLTSLLTDPASDPEQHPRCIRITSPSLSEPFSNEGGRYRLLSVPLDVEGPITGAFTDDIGGPDKTSWRMFAYENMSGRYSELPNDSIFSLEVGRGYWLITRDDHRLDTGPAEGLSTPTDSAFALELNPGYNLIGNPFAFTVAWDSIMIEVPGSSWLEMADAETTVVESPVKWIPGKGYDFDVSEFEPFGGYWIKNLLDSKIFLRIPPRESSVEVQAGAEDHILSDGWQINIGVSSAGERDCSNYIGVRNGASSEWDHHDRSEPPISPGRSLSLYFPHSSWDKNTGNYTVDIRGRYQDIGVSDFALPLLTERFKEGDLWGHAWNFDVAKNFVDEAGDNEVVIKLTGIESIPSEAVVYLIDRDLQRLIDLKANSRYSYYLGKKELVASETEARFSLIVGSAEFAEGQDLPEPPGKTALHQNYPNPFNPSTVIRYDVAKAGEAVLSIYDVRGALVRVLQSGYREPGRYEVSWSGKNNRGDLVASGIYFYQLKTEGYSKTRKMVILR